MKDWPILFIILVTVAFFWQFFLKGLLPIPGDTIVGLYHPFRDIYAKEYPRGIPFKNFLITDPVRQQYPWRNLSLDILKKGELPIWNPYSFAGTPLLANFQSAYFYPFNLLFFILPFEFGWSFLIIIEPLLAGIFMFLFLKNLKLNEFSSLFGAVVFSFSGFSVAWLEWGTIIHTVLWTPLILLSIDRILTDLQGNLKLQLEIKSYLVWGFVFTFSLISAFFAGHPQIFFYLFTITLVYFLVRWFQFGRSKKVFKLLAICYLLFAIATAIQWFPTIQFISESARSIDQTDWQKEGFFLPWDHLAQFFAPDFFGNPTTLNYWGVFNYGEFIGYIGVLSLLMAIFALFFRRDKKTLFFGTLFFLSLIFSLPTIFAPIPYLLGIPFISTSAPTRLLFITDFSLAILTALGFDLFLRHKKGIVYPIIFMTLIFATLWGFTAFGSSMFPEVSKENLIVSQRNLILPTLIFLISVILIYFSIFLKKRKWNLTIYYILLILLTFDLLRFGWKFTPFTEKQYLFPDSKALTFIKEDSDIFRIMTTDSRIFPPNFSAVYKIQSVDGYDPLYLQRYGELIAASERGEPNINPPFGFNRIITPHNYESKIIDLLGVKYVLSLKDLSSPKLEEVIQEGETRVYRNRDAYSRTFFVENVLFAKNKGDVIEKIFNSDLGKIAIIEDSLKDDFSVGKAEIINYSENKIIIKTENKGDGFLVLVETFYPTWKAKIDRRNVKIYRTDFNFRGIVVPKGKHNIEFENSLIW